MIVCTGNICRSPMAQIVLHEHLRDAGIDHRVEVDSTGVSDEEAGNPVDPRARRVLAAHGYPAGDGHRARQVRADQLAERDLVLAMTTRHASALRRIADGTEVDIRMYRSFDPAAPEVPDGGSESVLDVEDPWYGDLDGFETCLAQVEAAAAGIVAHVRAELAVSRS